MREGPGERSSRRRTSVATRLSLAALTVCVGSLVVTLLVGLGSGRLEGEDLLEQRLTAIRSTKVDAVERTIGQLVDQVTLLELSPVTSDAIERFSDAFDELAPADEEQADEVGEWYENTFLPELNAGRQQEVGLLSVLPLDPRTIALQSSYTITDDPGAVFDAGDGTAWSEAHRALHPTFRRVAQREGIDDVLLVDDAGRVVYSAAKGGDLGTDLRVGPYSGSGLSQVVRSAQQAGEPVVFDLSRYTAAAGRPAGFVAAPVPGGGTVAIRFNADVLTEAVNGRAEWEADGLGETGDTMVVGRDRLLRTDPRRFLESPEEFLARAEQAGLISDAGVDQVEALGTTVLVGEAESDLVARAVSGDGVAEVQDAFEDDIFAAYAPLDVGGLDWGLVTRIDAAEIRADLADYRNRVIQVSAIVVAVITFVVIFWANRLVRPVRLLSDRLRTRSGPLDVGALDEGAREFTDLSRHFVAMGTELQARRARVQDTVAERRAMLHALLPPSVATRVENGDRDVVDRVPDASVGALVIEGLSSLVRSDEAATGRAVLDDLVADLDALAEDAGVERIKLIGDVYLVTSGHQRPLLDHALRVVTFARGAIEVVARAGRDLGAHAAVHTGPVTVGLSGARGLVYDVWGPTVSEVYLLARVAEPGTVVVSAATRERLPEDLTDGAAPVESAADLVPGAVVLSRGEEVHPGA